MFKVYFEDHKDSIIHKLYKVYAGDSEDFECVQGNGKFSEDSLNKLDDNTQYIIFVDVCLNNKHTVKSYNNLRRKYLKSGNVIPIPINLSRLSMNLQKKRASQPLNYSMV